MIGTRALKYEQIKEKLNKSDNITIVSCNTCVRLADTGGEKKMKEIAMKLREDGFNIRDGFLITLPCKDSYFENVKINSNINTIIMLACASGCANALFHYPDVKIIPAVDNRGVVVTEIVTADDGTIKKRKKIRRIKV